MSKRNFNEIFICIQCVLNADNQNEKYFQRIPAFITIDFEKAVENAFALVFPQCKILGCFFHFKQSIWRNISELGLKKEFMENYVSRRTMKNLAALVFVPEQNVIQEFTHIKENASDVLDGK
ncbi:unnamed protein product [Rotaria sp. Silwood1]|nr:unnamed protein product [Rotaria sp. Silwood1]CAF4986113.1 unnamed protein product [Rotaria sp. Silwood1]